MEEACLVVGGPEGELQLATRKPPPQTHWRAGYDNILPSSTFLGPFKFPHGDYASARWVHHGWP